MIRIISPPRPKGPAEIKQGTTCRKRHLEKQNAPFEIIVCRYLESIVQLVKTFYCILSESINNSVREWGLMRLLFLPHRCQRHSYCHPDKQGAEKSMAFLLSPMTFLRRLSLPFQPIKPTCSQREDTYIYTHSPSCSSIFPLMVLYTSTLYDCSRHSISICPTSER